MADKIDINVRIGGRAGFGIMTAAQALAKTAKKDGLRSFTSTVYPSLIRGGHNTADIRISNKEVYSNRYTVDILLAMNTESIEKHTNSMTKGGIIIYDPKETKITLKPKVKLDYIELPIDEIAKKNGGTVMMNTVIVAAALTVLGIDINHFKEALKQIFKRKGEQVVNNNISCVDETVNVIKEKYRKKPVFANVKRENLNDHLMMTGNHAISMGALKAGCKFMSAYPMTPSTSIMETLAKYEKQHNFVVKHVEDELTSINMACGAAFAGVRALTASSGGGISLMIEGVGAAITEELPLVVVCATRTGPGSGMPTHTGQGDLNLVYYSGTGDAPRIVIAPGDIEEFFSMTFDAFNWAEEYQMVVFILTDKQAASSLKVFPSFKMDKLKIKRGKLLKKGDLDKVKDYKRYEMIKGDPISPRAIPGIKNGMHVSSTYVHGEHGHEKDDPQNKIDMERKLFGKLKLAKKNMPKPRIFGPKDAGISIISWGTTKQYVDQIREEMEEDGIKIRHMHVSIISPFPTEAIIDFIDSSKKLMLIEQNFSGQFNNLIKLNCQREIKDLYLQADGYTIDNDKVKAIIKSML
ncbi:MAG: 2-oxoacid:acceptor oxidoreductase subunit alpha [Candidatus Woesearchaeota archaeon]